MEEKIQEQSTPEPTPKSVAEHREMPSGHLLFAILATLFCCMPAGLVGIIYAAQVRRKWEQKDYVGAQEAARASRIWIIVAISLGLLIFLSLFVVNMVMEVMTPTEPTGF